MYLDYKDAKTFPFGKLQWNPQYCLILVGPQDHSGISKGDYSSIIAKLEQEDGFPPVIRMGRNGLKEISKSMFEEVLKSEIREGIIEADH